MHEGEEAQDARQLVKTLEMRAAEIVAAVDQWVHDGGSLAHVRRLSQQVVQRAHRGLWSYDARPKPCARDEHHFEYREAADAHICQVCYAFLGEHVYETGHLAYEKFRQLKPNRALVPWDELKELDKQCWNDVARAARWEA